MSLFGKKGPQDRNPLSPEAVTDKASFLAFLAALRQDFANNSGDCENVDLASYLEAMEAWTTDWQKFDAAPNPWQHAAQILLAGSRYE